MMPTPSGYLRQYAPLKRVQSIRFSTSSDEAQQSLPMVASTNLCFVSNDDAFVGDQNNVLDPPIDSLCRNRH
jgi:hypothetical protein